MLEGIKKWYHRQMVKSAVDAVKHWKREVYWPIFAGALIISLSVIGIFQGNFMYLLGIGMGALIIYLFLFWGRLDKVRYMSEQERIHFFAKWNRVEPDEVFARLKEKGQQLKE